MKKKLILAILVIGVVAWAAMKYFTPTPASSLPTIWVNAVPVKASTLPLEAQAIGTLVARSVEITPEVAGHISKILFKDGAYVAKDASLFQLDDALYKTKYDLANAKLAYSKNNFERTQLLGKKGVLSKQAVEQAEADFKEKMADAKENEVMLAKMNLTAPFAGQLGKRKINRGDYVTVGQALVTLTDTKHLHVEYTLPEKDLSALKVDQPVTITSIAYPGQFFQGKVAFISPTISTDNRSILLYAKVPNEQGLLAPGMFVNVKQSLGKETKAIMVPARSLVPILDGEQVFKIIEGRAYAVSVLVGKRTKEAVQILDGLKVGDMIITDGQLKIKNGMPVKIKT